MLKKFLKDASIYGISGFLSRGIAIFLIPFYTRVFTAADYGVIDLLAIISSIAAMSVSMQVTQAIARFYPSLTDKNEKVAMVSSALLFVVFSYLLFLITSLALSDWISLKLLDSAELSEVYSIWSSVVFFTGIFYFIQNQLKWRFESKKFAIVSLVYTILSLSLTILFVLSFGLKLKGVFLAKLIASILSSGMALFFIRDDLKLTFDRKILLAMLKFSIPLIPSSIGVYVTNTVHRILIKVILNLSSLGLYGMSSRLTSLVSVILNSFQGAITPLIMANYEKEETKLQIAKLMRYYTLFSILIFTSISIFAREILIVLTTPAYYEAYKLVPFLLIDKLFFAAYVLVPGLFIAKKTPLLAKINILSGFVNVLISFVLLKIFGLIGAAIGTMSSSLFMFVFQYNYSQKYYYVNHEKLKLILPFSFYIIIIGIVYTINFDINFYTITLKLLIILSIIPITIILGLINKAELSYLINQGLIKFKILK
jgi:O-antigen/teichoic acid export membrane protein